MRIYLLAVFTLLCTASLFSQNKAVFAVDGIAVRGYDVVAYVKDNKAVKGTDEFSYSWNGVKWLFSNNEDLQLFKGNPEKYVPQYGGYCAYGVSENHASPTNPLAFTIVDDKLYLNYSLKVKEMWLKSQRERIQRADTLWKKLKVTE